MTWLLYFHSSQSLIFFWVRNIQIWRITQILISRSHKGLFFAIVFLHNYLRKISFILKSEIEDGTFIYPVYYWNLPDDNTKLSRSLDHGVSSQKQTEQTVWFFNRRLFCKCVNIFWFTSDFQERLDGDRENQWRWKDRRLPGADSYWTHWVSNPILEDNHIC